MTYYEFFEILNLITYAFSHSKSKHAQLSDLYLSLALISYLFYVGEQLRLWQECADMQARLNIGCSPMQEIKLSMGANLSRTHLIQTPVPFVHHKQLIYDHNTVNYYYQLNIKA